MCAPPAWIRTPALHAFDFVLKACRAQPHHAEWLKAGDRHRKELVMDWNNEQGARWLSEARGQRATLLRGTDRNRLICWKSSSRASVACVSSARFEARCPPPPIPPHPVGKAWRNVSRTGWGEDLCGEMVLVVVIGALCWHPGRKVCWGDNMPWGGR